jgi:hypothetical protein
LPARVRSSGDLAWSAAVDTTGAPLYLFNFSDADSVQLHGTLGRRKVGWNGNVDHFHGDRMHLSETVPSDSFLLFLSLLPRRER